MSHFSDVLVFNRFQLIEAEEYNYKVVILKCEFCTIKLKIKYNLYILCNSSKSKVTSFYYWYKPENAIVGDCTSEN